MFPLIDERLGCRLGALSLNFFVVPVAHPPLPPSIHASAEHIVIPIYQKWTDHSNPTLKPMTSMLEWAPAARVRMELTCSLMLRMVLSSMTLHQPPYTCTILTSLQWRLPRTCRGKKFSTSACFETERYIHHLVTHSLSAETILITKPLTINHPNPYQKDMAAHASIPPGIVGITAIR